MNRWTTIYILKRLKDFKIFIKLEKLKKKKKKKNQKIFFLGKLKIRLDQIFRRNFREQWMFRAAYKGDYSQLGYLLWLWRYVYTRCFFRNFTENCRVFESFDLTYDIGLKIIQKSITSMRKNCFLKIKFNSVYELKYILSFW